MRLSWYGVFIDAFTAMQFVSNKKIDFSRFERAGWEQCHVATSYHHHVSVVTRQSIPALLDAAGIHRANHVLDVACGAGYVAAAAVNAGAQVIGIDFSAAQIQLARKEYPHVHFAQADVAALPFENERFDAVVCSFGMCHFPDPDRALREMFRVLKKGGRIAFTVWDTPEHTVGFGAIIAAIKSHGSAEVGLPDGPDFFLLSDVRESAKVILDAGFMSPSFTRAPQLWRMSNPDQLFLAVTEGSVRTAAIIRSQSDKTITAIKSELRKVVSGFQMGTHYELPMPAVVASATKPS